MEKGCNKVNTVALEKLVLNSLFLLIKTTSGANGSIKVGKLYNQVYFNNMFLMFLNMFLKILTLENVFRHQNFVLHVL